MTQQLANIMTKGLPTASFKEFRDSLCVISNDAHTAGGLARSFRARLHVLRLSLNVASFVSYLTVMYLYKGVSL
jgi:hypothetical protein